MFLDARIVTIPVSNLAEGLTWYSKVLGFEPAFSNRTCGRFICGGFDLELTSGCRPRLNHDRTTVYWRVDKLNTALARLLALGAHQVGKPFVKEKIGLTILVLDPFGNSLGLVQEDFSDGLEDLPNGKWI